MTTSPHRAPQPEPVNDPDAEFDLLVQEAPQHGGSHVWSPDDDQDDQRDTTVDADAPSVVWQVPDADDGSAGHHTGSHATGSRAATTTPTATPGATSTAATEYAAADGLPGRGVVLATLLAVAAVVALDLALVGALTFFFDLCFVVVCLVAAMSVRRQDLFTAAVLPPLVFAGAIAAVTVVFPEAILPAGAMGKVFMTGLAAHAEGLVGGYVVALLTVGARVYARRQP